MSDNKNPTPAQIPGSEPVKPHGMTVADAVRATVDENGRQRPEPGQPGVIARRVG
jgi:hypothetical protein